MTLLEMSVVYAEHAAVIRSRIVELRGLTRQETNPEAVQDLKRRWRRCCPYGRRPGIWPDSPLIIMTMIRRLTDESDQSGRQGRSISGGSGQLAAGKRPG